MTQPAKTATRKYGSSDGGGNTSTKTNRTLLLPGMSEKYTIHYLVLNNDEKLSAVLGKNTFDSIHEKGSKYSAKTAEGRTALHYAAVGGFTQRAVELISHGWSPVDTDSFGFSALDFTAYFGHSDCLRHFLTSCNIPFSSGITPFDLAALAGNYSCLSVLLENAKQNHIDLMKKSPKTLHFAVYGNCPKCTSLLLDNNYSIESSVDAFIQAFSFDIKKNSLLVSCDPTTPLVLATMKNSKDSLKTMIDSLRIDSLSAARKKEILALLSPVVISAAKYNAVECASYLLNVQSQLEDFSSENTDEVKIELSNLDVLQQEYEETKKDDSSSSSSSISSGSDSSLSSLFTDIEENNFSTTEVKQQLPCAKLSTFKDSESNTPLHFSCLQISSQLTGLFLKAGYSPTDKNSLGQTPIELAAMIGSVSSLCAIHCFYPTLLSSFRTEKNETVLHLCCLFGRVQSVMFLLGIGCSPLDRTSEGFTALHCACLSTKSEGTACIKPVIERAKMINDDFLEIISSDGRTALHCCCVSGNLQSLLLLAQEKANIDAITNSGLSPILVATKYGFPALVKTLFLLDANLTHRDNNGNNILHICAEYGMVQTSLFVLNSLNVKAKKLTKKSVQNENNEIKNNEDSETKKDDKTPQISDDKTKAKEEEKKEPEKAYIAYVELISDKNNDGKLPLEIAIESRMKEMICTLIRRGTSISTLSSNGVSLSQLLIDKKLFEQNDLLLLEEERNAFKAKLLKQTSEYTSVSKIAVEKFNTKPATGIEYLQSAGWLSSDPAELADFVAETVSLNPTVVGEYLGNRSNTTILKAFIARFDFHNKPIDEALRMFLTSKAFRLPGESQIISRFMEAFSEFYFDQNVGLFCFKDSDACFTLSFSIILLNTDAHNAQVKNKMSREDFIRNNRGTNQGEDFPEDFLTDLYNRIIQNEIKIELPGMAKETLSGWIVVKYSENDDSKRRWVVLKNGLLAVYKQQPTSPTTQPLFSCLIDDLESLTQTTERKRFLIFLIPKEKQPNSNQSKTATNTTTNTPNTSVAPFAIPSSPPPESEKKAISLCFNMQEEWQRWHRGLYEGIYKTPFLGIIGSEQTKNESKRRIILRIEPLSTSK